MNIGRKRFSIKWLVLIISLSILTSCNKNEQEIDNVGAGPTIEEVTDNKSSKDKSEIIEEAIKKSEQIIRGLNSIGGISSSMVFINHEAVLVAVKLEKDIELSKVLRNKIEENVYNVYPEAKNIAISCDEYVYESISKLLTSYKKNDQVGELLKDLQEILKDLL